MTASFPTDALHFPATSAAFLEPYLPPPQATTEDNHHHHHHQQQTEKGRDRDDGKPHKTSLPFATLTFATSLDSALSLAPGVRTVLSGPQSKAMTHYLRSRHQAILIGVGTADADDPGLNCRIEGADGYKPIAAAAAATATAAGDGQHAPDPAIHQALAEKAASDPELKTLMKAVGMGHASAVQLQAFQSHVDEIGDIKTAEHLERVRRMQETLQQPRPIVVDPNARWAFHEHSKLFSLVRQGKGKAPFVIISKTTTPAKDRQDLLEKYGGKFIAIETVQNGGGGAGAQFDWNTILHILATQENIQSIMIEGGGSIINSILSEPRYSALFDSVIVTIAPTWLGQGGVVVSPNRRFDENGCAIPASRLTDVQWHPFGEDVVLCGRFMKP